MPSPQMAPTATTPNDRVASTDAGSESKEKLCSSSRPIFLHSKSSSQKTRAIANGSPNRSTSDIANASVVSNRVSTNTAPTPALTYQNLASHGYQTELGWNDSGETFRLRQEASDAMRLAVRNLGVDLPENIMRKVVQKSDGMMPMERFTDDRNSQIPSCAVKPSDEAPPSPAVPRWDNL